MSEPEPCLTFVPTDIDDGPADGGAAVRDASANGPGARRWLQDSETAVVSVCLTTTAEADDRRAKQQTGFD